MRMLLRVCLALFISLQLSSAWAMEQTTVKISFVLATDVVEPVARHGVHTGYSGTLVLTGKAVNEQWTSVKLSGSNSNYHSDNSGLGGTWRVLSANTIGASWRMTQVAAFNENTAAALEQVAQPPEQSNKQRPVKYPG